MRSVLLVARRELVATLRSPLGFVVAALVLMLAAMQTQRAQRARADAEQGDAMSFADKALGRRHRQRARQGGRAGVAEVIERGIVPFGVEAELGRKLAAYLWPDNGDTLPDNRALKLVILHPESAGADIPTWIERKGETFRVYKNTLVFALADTAAFARLRDKIKIMIGGAPVTQAFADQIGADGYASNAAAAAELAKKFVS